MENQKSKILLVEDDTLLRNAFRLLLEDAGYVVYEAGSVAQAIKHALADTPDVVLLDLGLPDGPGLDVARELRLQELTRDTPIIALTGRVGAEEKAECLAAGCTSYLAKPVESKVLIGRLKELVTK